MSSFPVILRTELRLTMRDFFSVFFALVFPSLMLFIFGNLFGGYPGQYGATMLDDMTPAYSCIVIGVTGLLSFPLTLSANLELGVYRRFEVTPAGSLPIIWGELLANLVLTFAGLGVLFLFAWAVFGVHPHGSWAALVGTLFLSAAAMFSLGLLITAALPARSALAVCYTVYFVMLFLSGATLPAMLFSSGLKAISDCLPMTYAVRLTQAVFIGGARGVATDLTILTGTAAAAGWVGSFLLRRRFL